MLTLAHAPITTHEKFKMKIVEEGGALWRCGGQQCGRSGAISDSDGPESERVANVRPAFRKLFDR